jgi:hypothetical protein
MRKRNFLLLEVLIALSLLTICLVPLVKQPLKLYKKEIEHLEDLELERVADWTFMEVKEMFLKGEISWNRLPDHIWGETQAFALSPTQIQIPGCQPKTFKRSFTLITRGEKVGKNDEIYRQIYVKIFLNKQRYEFRIPVEKKSIKPIIKE